MTEPHMFVSINHGAVCFRCGQGLDAEAHANPPQADIDEVMAATGATVVPLDRGLTDSEAWRGQRQAAESRAAIVEQSAVVSEVAALVARYSVEHDIHPAAMCLYHAVFAVEAIRRRGRRAILQAGSATWRMVAPEVDDGVSPTHLAYEWSPESPASRAAMARGHLPEMHVWAAVVDPPALVDLAAGFWPEQAMRLHGYTWRAPMPPAYVWGVPPPGAGYRPDPHATLEAVKYAAILFGVDRAKALVL